MKKKPKKKTKRTWGVPGVIMLPGSQCDKINDEDGEVIGRAIITTYAHSEAPAPKACGGRPWLLEDLTPKPFELLWNHDPSQAIGIVQEARVLKPSKKLPFGGWAIKWIPNRRGKKLLKDTKRK